MTGTPDGKPWRRGRWVLAAILVLAIYVLSFGPAVWLSNRLDPHHNGWVGVATSLIYGPLVMASDVVGAKGALLNYLSLFVDVKR